MGKEVQYKVGPEDIKACSLQCTECESEITSVIDAAHPWPESCPMCAAIWHRDNQVDKAKYFIALLREAPTRVKVASKSAVVPRCSRNLALSTPIAIPVADVLFGGID